MPVRVIMTYLALRDDIPGYAPLQTRANATPRPPSGTGRRSHTSGDYRAKGVR